MPLSPYGIRTLIYRDKEKKFHGNNISWNFFYLIVILAGEEGLDLPPAGPELHLREHSFRGKIPLQIATGNLHPE
jgi:hypothetical protein